MVLSYSFFSAGPLDNAVKGRYMLLHEQYEKDRSRVLAAKALRAEIARMDAPTKDYYRRLFMAIHAQAGERSEAVTEKIAARDAKTIREATGGPDGPDAKEAAAGAKSPAEAAPEAAPETQSEAPPPARLGDLDLAGRAAHRESSEALEGTRAAFSEALGMATGHYLEGMDGVIKEYVDVLVEQVGDFITEKAFRWTSGALAREKPATDETIRETVAHEAREITEHETQEHETHETETDEKPPERDAAPPHH